MTEKVLITRRSIVGFGYNAGCSQHWNKSMTNSWLAPDPTEKPCHAGTILQVSKAIEEDKTLESFQSGGTYYTKAWFVRVRGCWRKMTENSANIYEMDGLTMERDKEDQKYSGRKYYQDVATIEIE